MDENNSETCAVFVSDGAVELYHDNVKHFETTSIGCKLSDNDTNCCFTICKFSRR